MFDSNDTRKTLGVVIDLPPLSSQSTQNNKSRLKVLQRHDEHVQSLFDAAREQLLELSKDKGRYSQFLESLILQVRHLYVPSCMGST